MSTTGDVTYRQAALMGAKTLQLLSNLHSYLMADSCVYHDSHCHTQPVARTALFMQCKIQTQPSTLHGWVNEHQLLSEITSGQRILMTGRIAWEIFIGKI